MTRSSTKWSSGACRASAPQRRRCRSLIEAIVLIPDDAGLRVEVRGELEATLAFGEGRKNPGPRDRDSAKQIKMVAGVRNPLYRTLFKYPS